MSAYMFNMPYHGHINPCLALIQELSARGEHIVFYGVERFRATVENAGAEFRAFEYEETETATSLCMMAEWQLRIVEKTLDTLIADVQREAPAYVMVDYTCLWGRFLCEHLKLPAVVIHTTYPVVYTRTRLIQLTLREIYRTPHGWRRIRQFWSGMRRISRRWSVTRLAIPYQLLFARYGDLHLVLTSPEMASPAVRLDPRYAFVGPCVRAPGTTQAEALPSLDERPLLYISLGTVWPPPPGLYRAAIEAFSNAPVQVLITGRQRIPDDVLLSFPKNFHAREYVDQIAVLRRAAVFITHGGMNSVCEALLAAVPMLVCPIGFDQFEQSRYVERVGCGFSLEGVPLGAEALRSRIERLMEDPSIRANCLRVRERLTRLGGAPKAASLVMQLAEANRGSSSAASQNREWRQSGTARVRS